MRTNIPMFTQTEGTIDRSKTNLVKQNNVKTYSAKNKVASSKVNADRGAHNAMQNWDKMPNAKVIGREGK